MPIFLGFAAWMCVPAWLLFLREFMAFAEALSSPFLYRESWPLIMLAVISCGCHSAALASEWSFPRGMAIIIALPTLFCIAVAFMLFIPGLAITGYILTDGNMTLAGLCWLAAAPATLVVPMGMLADCFELKA